MEQNKERRYAENLLRQYGPKTERETDLEKLKRLDAKVRRPAEVFAGIFGGVGALVLGTGMCLSMGVIGNMAPLGIVVGIVGIGMVAANYFLYKAILKSRRKKYADRVIALSNGLLNQ